MIFCSFLFLSSLLTEGSIAISSRLSLLISEENLNQPLSDENLRNLLSTQHLVNIARRTVTKYRIEAGFGSTRARKNL